ncbi:MAG: bifunctional aspartate kinase/diaminopimelate decarboxylase [Acidobacteria bacterium]|jgi:diaminopimelate decarboxylase/aspartate kinase|nr:bifunctional aspartate kinase/diaminopimelate decarboxylase [Acidobacteriota bacterium]
MSRPWVVLKFGGTSVAAAEHWDTIAAEARGHAAAGRRALLVCSALAGATNRLEQALAAAAGGARGGETELEALRAAHEGLAHAGGVAPPPEVDALWDELARWLAGVRLTGEAPPRLTAKVLALGELASTRLGAALLEARGVAARWIDARELLVSAPRPRDLDARRYLEAAVPAAHDPARLEAASAGAAVAITQGFIARTPEGDTCLLGRGGSDTSGALFAALAGAERLEIWTDVPGLFTADPREVPEARLLHRVGYREARELATLGARVLHPPCLEPVACAGIPVAIRCTPDPALPRTLIEAAREDHPAVTAVTHRRGTTLLTISTVAMWDASGFLARLFAPFEQLGFSVDLVGTSEAAVSVTLDRVPGGVEGAPFAALVDRLRDLGEVRVIHPCAVVSIVGRRIRSVLGELGGALGAFQDRPVHLVSNSSEDLNLSFVVDEDDGAVLVRRLHAALFADRAEDPRLGPAWIRLRGGVDELPREAWWRREREALLALAVDGRARYAYHLPTVRERARQLTGTLRSVDRFYYAMKANPFPAILEAVASEGLGIECVSIDEVRRARDVLGDAVPLLFTPNFCPVEEYAAAREAGAELTLDGPHLFAAAPSLWRGAEVALRIDPGWGLGHHAKVTTGGSRSKFGHPAGDTAAFLEAAAAAGVRVRGLHAHLGSGILDAAAWAGVGRALAALAEAVGPDLAWIDLGGGLGVPERPGQRPLDLDALEASLHPLAAALGPVRLRMEPGRFLVAEAGVLLAPVTQVRRKGDALLVGVATGMNSLIRPALYGAWHPIVNLSRLGDPPDAFVQVVGPICESGDVLGRDRWLPEPRPGDLLLIGFAGAYGAAMASRYNLREPAREVALG